MKRGTIVRVNEKCQQVQLIGETGVVIGMNTDGSYRLVVDWHGYYCLPSYPIEEIDIISTPDNDLTPGDVVKFESPNKGKTHKKAPTI